MTEYIKRDDAIEALMSYFVPPIYTGRQVDQAKRIAESIINGVPTEEILQCEDAIDRYSALAVLNPCSVEYKEIKALPPALIKSPKHEIEEDRLRWIPINEELPDEDEDVLVTVYFKGIKTRYSTGYVDRTQPCYYVDIAKHIGGDWQSMSDEYKVSLNRHVVIAWQPLPEPYKGE